MSTDLTITDSTLLKAFGPDRTYPYGTGNRLVPGKWSPTRKPVLCKSGWHYCTGPQIVGWLNAELWLVEVDGKIVHGDYKSCAERIRLVEQVTAWDERTARLFGADCAEHVLPIFEQECPGDERPRQAIETARAFAEGTVTRSDLAAAGAAARDAARAATGVAAWDAARAAACAAACAAAWDAALDAACAAVRDAAGIAAWAAARAAEQAWQWERLCHYLTGGAR